MSFTRTDAVETVWEETRDGHTRHQIRLSYTKGSGTLNLTSFVQEGASEEM